MEAIKKQTITAHCIVKNEECFVRYAILSVIDYVDQVIVFDTGSTDTTPVILSELARQYPKKIIFEQKGECDKKRHTELRQEMLECTHTDWFMILDGDEVWTNRAMKEIIEEINTPNAHHWMIVPYYVCVGDVYHTYYNEKYDSWYRRTGFHTPRIIKMSEDIEWRGDYEVDTLFYKSTGKNVYVNTTDADMYFLKQKYWHLTFLRRSTQDDKVYTSGLSKTRAEKRRLTHFIIGKKIYEPVPEVFANSPYAKQMGKYEAVVQFVWLCVSKPKLLYRWIMLVVFKKQ